MHRMLTTISIKTRVLWNFQTTRPREAFSGPILSTSSSQRIRNLWQKNRKKERNLYSHLLLKVMLMDKILQESTNHTPGSGSFRTALVRSSFTAGLPTPGPGTDTSLWPARTWAAQQEVSRRFHLYLQLFPITHITAWILLPVRSVMALDSHRSMNPTVNWTCKGSRLHAPYENLMPDDLRWSWGGDASTGEWLQIQIIISREIWLQRPQ